MNELSHTNKDGKAKMVNVGDKPDQKRTAIAEGFISLAQETVRLVENNKLKKGNVIAVAHIAGIQAAKKTSELIPLCHPLSLHNIEISEEILNNGIKITSQIETIGKTGVEMEALTAVCASLLAIYDMCKSVDKNMIIEKIKLIEKRKV
jgi:cyclic pyranopterin monophosphate synthase